MESPSLLLFFGFGLAIQHQGIVSLYNAALYNAALYNAALYNAALYNAALYKPAWQSSTRDGRIANFGKDGITQTKIGSSFVGTETDYDNPAWWMVDLKGQYVIEQIVLYNRNDEFSFANRLHLFQIDGFDTDPRQLDNFLNISGDVCFTLAYALPGGRLTCKCKRPVTGRYVRLIRYAEDYFNIIELQVMVSRELITFSSFTRHSDVPFIVSVNVSSPKECLQRCMKLKSESRCTAFSWMSSNKECRFLGIDTRQKDSILSNLTSFTGANFYMESH